MRTVALEAASDEALADSNGDQLADLALVGRFAVRTPEDVTTLVAKILAYEQAPPAPRVLLAADAADAEYNFTALSEQLAAALPAGWPRATAYVDTLGPAGAHSEILTRLAEGPALVTYTGHGSTTVWGAGASLFSTTDAAALTNTPPTGLLVALNCLNGFFTTLYPPEAGLAEALQRAPGGAVAIWASSSLTLADGQLAAATHLLTRLAAGTDLTLGDALRAAKQATTDDDVRASWILFGDPAMRIGQP
jgi:hypothetical protein